MKDSIRSYDSSEDEYFKEKNTAQSVTENKSTSMQSQAVRKTIVPLTNSDSQVPPPPPPPVPQLNSRPSSTTNTLKCR